METTATQERLLAIAEAAFLPLETHASLEEGGHYQIRVLDGSEAVHIEEMPARELRDEADLTGWIERMRGRLEERGYKLKTWESHAAAR
jgi:hypothetical protein